MGEKEYSFGGRNLSFNNISKYRDRLMGLAAVFIMVCHNSLFLPDWFYSINFGFIRPFFQVGVDFFLILSGLGCYYSFKKCPSTLKFYKKRFLRIIPTYVLFVIVYGVLTILFGNRNITDFLYQYSIISFFISGELKVWFVAAIIVLYLAFPLIYYLLEKLEIIIWIFIVVIVILLLLPVWTPLQYIDSIFTTRVPSFLLGAIIGKRIFGNQIIITKKLFRLYITLNTVCIFAFVMNGLFNNYNKWIVFRLLFVPIAFFSTVIISNTFEIIKCKDDFFGRTLKKIGSVSFETYLIHVPLLSALDIVFNRFIKIDIIAEYSSNILAIVLAVFGGILLKKIVDSIINHKVNS